MNAAELSLPPDERLVHDMRLAMRRTAAGVAIVTTLRDDGEPAGITVSSFGPLSLDPPSVLACVNSDSRTLAAILASRVFAANVLAEGQAGLAERFAGSHAAQERFAHGRWSTLVTGSPVLEGAVSTLDCRLATSFVYGSHRIIVGDVAAVRLREAKPLVYHSRTYGRFGL